MNTKPISMFEGVSCKLNNLEQYSRPNCLQVSGVSETINEHTDTITKGLEDEKPNITVSKNDIDRSRRIGKPKKLAFTKLVFYST